MKALIIDDNHSFIDLLKNALKPFRLQIDSFYKFSDAREMLFKNGCYLNQNNVNEIFRYHDAISKGSGKSTPAVPELSTPVINPDGYSLVFLEYDAEPSMKGTHFIQDILRNQKDWTEKNFILLSSDPQKVEPLAKKMKIVLVEKPIKKDYLLKMVNEYIQSVKQKEQEISELMEKYGIKVRIPDSDDKKRPAKSSKSVPKPKVIAKAKPAAKTNKSKNKAAS